MAWNPTSGAWKSPPATSTREVNDSSFPGLKPVSSQNAVAKFENTDIQENELVALKAIYGEDFANLTADQGAWKVTYPISIRPFIACINMR